MNLIYKISPADLWRNALSAGRFTGAPIDIQDGYIHFSTAFQARETADKHFNGQSDLVLVAVDADRLGDCLKWEPSRAGALFPHLYDALEMAAVVWTKPLPIGPEGHHMFPREMV